MPKHDIATDLGFSEREHQGGDDDPDQDENRHPGQRGDLVHRGELPSGKDDGGSRPENQGHDGGQGQILPERRILGRLVHIDVARAQSRLDPPAFDRPVVIVPASQRQPPGDETWE